MRACSTGTMVQRLRPPNNRSFWSPAECFAAVSKRRPCRCQDLASPLKGCKRCSLCWPPWMPSKRILDGWRKLRFCTYEGEAGDHGAVVLAGQDFVAGHHRCAPLLLPLGHFLPLSLLCRLALLLSEATILQLSSFKDTKRALKRALDKKVVEACNCSHAKSIYGFLYFHILQANLRLQAHAKASLSQTTERQPNAAPQPHATVPWQAHLKPPVFLGGLWRQTPAQGVH